VRRRFDSHVRIARVTFPIWLYVSVSGVVIYLVLYRWPIAPL
jgi:protein SCO1